MGEWTVRHVGHRSQQLGIFRPGNLNFSLVNCDEGPISYELAMYEPAEDSFGPYRSDWILLRGTNIINSGMHTGLNMNKDRDTLLVSGMDWLHYLKRRQYPFDPVQYRTVATGYYKTWPKKWVDEDLRDIVHDILRAMINDDPAYTPDFILGNGPSGTTHRYKIYPADSTKVFDHIKALSEVTPGFEFAISPVTREFFMYYPDRDSGNPVYHIHSTGSETTGQITEMDWVNQGPRGTHTLGLGSGGKARNMGSVKTDIENKKEFRRLDITEDFGELSSQAALDKLTAFHGSTNLGPEKMLSLSALNPEFLTPNFYTGSRPRSLIGNRVRVSHDFGYRNTDSYYIIQAMNFNVDLDGNEEVEFELERIAPRLV